MPTTETRRLNPLMLWGIFLAVIVLVFAAVRMFTREIIEVRVAAVNHQNLLSTVSTNGKVEPIEVFPGSRTRSRCSGEGICHCRTKGQEKRSLD